MPPSLRLPKESKVSDERISHAHTPTSLKGPDLQALSAALYGGSRDLDTLRQLCLDESIILSSKQLMPVSILGEGAFGIVWKCALHPRDQPPTSIVQGGGAPATLEGLLGASSISSPTRRRFQETAPPGIDLPPSTQTADLRFVALKHVKFPTAHPNSSALERRQQVSKALELFSRELLSLKALSHRNVVSYVGAVLYRADEDEDDIEADGGGRQMLAIVQEFAPWGSLAPLFQDKVAWARKFSTGDGLRWAHHIAQGMAYLHGCKPPIMHRDIKPENVLLCMPNASAKLCDFGICAFDRNSGKAEEDEGYFKVRGARGRATRTQAGRGRRRAARQHNAGEGDGRARAATDLALPRRPLARARLPPPR
jgi:serine/threonine protein kinase